MRARALQRVDRRAGGVAAAAVAPVQVAAAAVGLGAAVLRARARLRERWHGARRGAAPRERGQPLLRAVARGELELLGRERGGHDEVAAYVARESEYAASCS